MQGKICKITPVLSYLRTGLPYSSCVNVQTMDNAQRWQRLGEMIVERRVEIGWTQAQFSVAAGVAAKVISDMENGRRADYQISTLVKVQTALGWATGSIQDVLAGGEPTLRIPNSGLPA